MALGPGLVGHRISLAEKPRAGRRFSVVPIVCRSLVDADGWPPNLYSREAESNVSVFWLSVSVLYQISLAEKPRAGPLVLLSAGP